MKKQETMLACCINCGPERVMAVIIDGDCYCLTCDHNCGPVEDNEE